MNINEIKIFEVTATQEELDDYLLNPPFWNRHTLTKNTPNIDSILEDIFCRKAIKKMLAREYPQSDFKTRGDTSYLYSASRQSLQSWKWAVSVRIRPGDGTTTSYELNSGEFEVQFQLN